MTDLRPNSIFYDDGNCLPCHHINNTNINWDQRLFELREQISKFVSKNKSHNCLLGVSEERIVQFRHYGREKN